MPAARSVKKVAKKVAQPEIAKPDTTLVRRARRMDRILAETYPDATAELDFTNPFECLVVTVISAQTTDRRVNAASPALFAAYPTPEAMAAAPREHLEQLLGPLGFFRAKTDSVLKLSQALVEEHDGQVPAKLDELVKLPGVGRKTANVVLGHALGVPGLPVDRHVLRVSNRIGIAEGDDPVKVEEQLCAKLPKEMWTLASDVQILHGRRICKPKPLCDQCSVQDDCDYFRLVISRGGPDKARPPAGRRGRPSGRLKNDDARKVRKARR